MYIIDRFEGSSVIIEQEDETFIAVPRDAVPEDANEGDVLIQSGMYFIINAEETARRGARIRKKLDRLFSKNN